jgi:hypothetical protein
LHHTSYGNGEWFYDFAPKTWNLAYSNTTFRATLADSNGAGQAKPRFARQEVGAHSNGWDILPTLYDIYFTTNGVSEKLIPGSMVQSAERFPISKDFSEAPHNGQVRMDLHVWINSPYSADDSISQRETLINPAFTWQQSADAGTYACQMVVTLTAI